MKNRIVKFLLSSMMVLFSSPIIQVWGKETEVNAGVIKEFDSILNDSMKNISKKTFRKVYTTANVNIRSAPDIESKLLDVIEFNKRIKIYDCNDEWAIIKLKKSDISYA